MKFLFGSYQPISVARVNNIYNSLSVRKVASPIWPAWVKIKDHISSWVAQATTVILDIIILINNTTHKQRENEEQKYRNRYEGKYYISITQIPSYYGWKLERITETWSDTFKLHISRLKYLNIYSKFALLNIHFSNAYIQRLTATFVDGQKIGCRRRESKWKSKYNC